MSIKRQLDWSEPSTREREKRFNRTNNRENSRASRSKSNRSDNSPIPKFFMKNVLGSKVIADVEPLISMSIQSLNCLCESAVTNIEVQTGRDEYNQRKQNKQVMMKLQEELNSLKIQIKRYHEFVNEEKKKSAGPAQNQRLKQLEMKLNQQIELNEKLEEENLELRKKIKRSSERLSQNNSVKSLKADVLQSRLEECEETIENLKNENLKLKQELSKTKRPQKTKFLNHNQQNIDENRLNSMLEMNHTLQNQIWHLNVKHSSQLAKMKRQMDFVRRLKEKQYGELKDKFIQYLKNSKDKISHANSNNLQMKHQHTDQEIMSLDLSKSEQNQFS